MGYKLYAHRREGKLVSDTVGIPSGNDEVVLAIFKNEVVISFAQTARELFGAIP
ncbi:hypothetical protein BN8_00979 [Fibrisoma limi BUZ 3]|uniref:Uncharacterized protein n=1 Tax=Fibrisoma limi BUZ 3 TaxID=1185876 RepID=I2GDN8_9BACT|nr:hypothetical protein [Fibrisoma limi]CCH52012.1 hypothetical protein BN8_00979 [Fibrisoma limi BUZ 3]